MTEKLFEETYCMSEIFVKREGSNAPIFIIVKVVDYLLIVGTKADIQIICNKIVQQFKVGRIVRGRDLIFNRLQIFQKEEGNFMVEITEYMHRIGDI